MKNALKHKLVILLTLSIIPLSSCRTLHTLDHEISQVPPAIAGGGLGAAIGAVAFDSNPATGAVLGAVAGYGAVKIAQKKKEEKQLQLYNDGYIKGRSDSVKTLYWAQRNAQREAASAPVEYRYMEVPVPSHVTSDGVLIDEHYRVIEVVE